MPEEVKNDQVNLPKNVRKAPLSRAVELSTKYGGLHDIPAWELNEIGFKLVDENLVPLEGFAIEYPKKKKLNTFTERSFEDKMKAAPFGEIRVELSGKEVPFRRLSPLQVEGLRNKLGEISGSFNSVRGFTFLSQNIAFRTFAKEFFIKDKSVDPEDEEYAKEDILYWSSMVIGRLSEYLDEDSLVSNHLKEEADGEDPEFFMPSDESEKLYQELERLKGKLSDKTELEKDFHEVQDREFEDDDIESFEKYCQENGLLTNFKVGTHFFGRFLEAYDVPELSEALRKAESIIDVRKILEEKRPDLLTPLVDEEKRLREEMRSSSIEAKMSLSGKLKAIKEKKDNLRTIIDGLAQYYHAPDLISEAVQRKIKEIQDFLVSGKGIDEDLVIYLDGTPDIERDRDPGAISGDCTEGHPLPFADPNIPLYNIKVFSSKKEHFGNIYFLETNAEEFDKPVWHLEAIQIPDYRIDWPEAIPQIFKAIAQESVKKDIAMITVNIDSVAISNYDYIAGAVNQHWHRSGGDTTTIDLPFDEDDEEREFSPFQSDGHVKIVWKNK